VQTLQSAQYHTVCSPGHANTHATWVRCQANEANAALGHPPHRTQVRRECVCASKFCSGHSSSRCTVPTRWLHASTSVALGSAVPAMSGALNPYRSKRLAQRTSRNAAPPQHGARATAHAARPPAGACMAHAPRRRVRRGRPRIRACIEARGGLGHRHPTLAHGALAQHVDHVVDARRAALGNLGR